MVNGDVCAISFGLVGHEGGSIGNTLVLLEYYFNHLLF